MAVELLVADIHPDVREGAPFETMVVIRFPSTETARAFYDSEEYQRVIHHRTDNSEGGWSSATAFSCPRDVGRATGSVLGAAETVHPVAELGRVLDDLGEAHDGHGVLHRDPAAVDLLEEMDHLVDAAELRVVMLDVPRRRS